MPWLKQEQYYYCVPASIQMWALFDNSQFRVSQTTIASYVHTVPPDGTPATNVAPGVNYYTATKDASLLDAFYTAQAQFDSMQITSINNQRPFIAVFNQQHVVVVSGGSWHVDDVNSWDVWDTVIYQDPSAGPDLELDASTWHENVSAMVIGAAATADAQANFNEYGDNVVLRGSIQHGPYAY
jgi:Peptidase_C39 like family